MAKKSIKTELTDSKIKDETKKASTKNVTKSTTKSKKVPAKSKPDSKVVGKPLKVDEPKKVTKAAPKATKKATVKKTAQKKVAELKAEVKPVKIEKKEKVAKKVDEKKAISAKVEETKLESKTPAKKAKAPKKTKAKATVKSTPVDTTQEVKAKEVKVEVKKADVIKKPEIVEEIKVDSKTATKKKKAPKKSKAKVENTPAPKVEEVKAVDRIAKEIKVEINPKKEKPKKEERVLNLVLKADMKPEIKEEVVANDTKKDEAKKPEKVEEIKSDSKTTVKKKKAPKKSKAKTENTPAPKVEEIKAVDKKANEIKVEITPKKEEPKKEERVLNLVLKADMKPEIKEEIDVKDSKDNKKVVDTKKKDDTKKPEKVEEVKADSKTATKKKKAPKKSKVKTENTPAPKVEVAKVVDKKVNEIKVEITSKKEEPKKEERVLNLVLKADLKPEVKEEAEAKDSKDNKKITDNKKTVKSKKVDNKIKVDNKKEDSQETEKVEEVKADFKATNKKKKAPKKSTAKAKESDVKVAETQIDEKKLNLVLKSDIKVETKAVEESKKVEEVKKTPIVITKSSDRFKPVPLRIFEEKKSNQKTNNNKTKTTDKSKSVHILKINEANLLNAKQKREAYYKNLFANLNDFLSKDLYLDKNIRIVIGVSGGCDSIVLLDILANLSIENKFTLFIAHFDHSLRKESPQDLEFVKEMAHKYNIKFFSKKENVKDFAAKRSFSVEEAARVLRYEFYEEISEKVDANFVALGHNANDSTETFFINLLRGSGLSGLSGIPHKRSLNQNVNVIRPVINLSRQEIEEYANKRELKWIEDQSNKENIYLRNKIRNELLPFMQEKFDRDIVRSVNRTSKLINAADIFIYHKVKKYVAEVIIEKKTSYVEIDLVKLFLYDDFVKAEIIGLILKNNFNFINLTQNIVKGILNLYNSEPGASFAINEKLTVYKDRDTMFIARNQLFRSNTLLIDNLGEFKFENKIFKLSKCPKTKINYGESENIEYFDLDYMPDKLEIRHIQDGDKFTPIGMTGRIKVNDFLTNNKIPLLKKKDILVLTDRVNIIWLCQNRIADQYKVTDSTHKVLKIEMIEKK